MSEKRCERNRHRRFCEDLAREMRKYRIGQCVPVYHNRCGARTTYLPCRCAACSAPVDDALVLAMIATRMKGLDDE